MSDARVLRRSLVSLSFSALLLAGGSSILADDLPRQRCALDQPWDMQHIKLELDVDIEREHVDAVATLTMTATREAAAVRLDAVKLDTHGVTVAIGSGPAQEARHANTGQQIEVFLEQPIPRGEKLTAVIRYAVHEPEDGLHFFKRSDDDPDAPNLLWSQGESIENRYWFPSFDHPNEKQTSEMIVTADAKYTVVSNGKLLSKEPAETPGATNGERRMHWHWLQDQPHAAYLVTLVVGELVLREEPWRGISVQYYVPADHVDDVPTTFSHTPDMLSLFSDRTGVKYPWDRYAQVCCYGFGGGMENTSATTMTDRMLHGPRAHADHDQDGLISHEMAHQWFGDLLTCKDWSHIWLNEGSASYFEAIWEEQRDGADGYAYEMFGKERGALRAKERPIVDYYYVRPDDTFDDRAYPKGAWVLHMLRCRLGDELFWKTINQYLTQYSYQSVETADLRRVAERVSGRSLERFFFDWTARPGHPSLDVTLRWDADQKLAEVRVKQNPAVAERKQNDDAAAANDPWPLGYRTEPFHFPLTIDFYTPGLDAPKSVTREVESAETTIMVSLPDAPRMVIVDPANAVLKEIKEEKGQELWIAQLREAPQLVARIRAARVLAERHNDSSRQALAAALSAEKFWGGQVEIANALGKVGGDVARDALLAALGRGGGSSVAAPHATPDGEKPTGALTDAHARRACAEALSEFKDDAAVRGALRSLIMSNDEFDSVRREAVNAYAKLKSDDQLEIYRQALEIDSHHEEIRSAALNALDDIDDVGARALLVDWTSPGKPRECRRAAASALGKALKDVSADDAALAPGIEHLLAGVRSKDRRLRSTAIRALGGLGSKGSAAVPALREISEKDKRKDLRDAAREAITSIEKDQPAQEQIKKLRKEVGELRDSNKSLREQMEGLSRAGPH